MYTNLQSKVCFHFCFQVRRPVISTIVNLFMSFYEKSLPKYFLPKYFFLFLKKQPPKQTHVSIFYLIFKGPAFQYHKVWRPNFWIYYILKWIFEIWAEKRSFLHKCFGKRLVKNTINEISKNNRIAHLTDRNLKTAYLQNFYFH